MSPPEHLGDALNEKEVREGPLSTAERSDRDLESGPNPQTANILGPKHSVYKKWQKQLIVLCSAIGALFAPLSSQIFLPALPSIAESLKVTQGQINFTVTTYMVIQAILPMFVGTLADRGGRRPAYLACFVTYIAANIGLALAPNYGAMLGLRALQAAGSSPTVALCSAIIADVATSAERGAYVGITAVPSVLGPALGPLIGGALSQSMGWRSIFWFLAILAGMNLAGMLLFMPETCRLITGDGSIVPPRIYQTPWQLFKRLEPSTEKQDGDNVQTEEKKKSTFSLWSLLTSLRMMFEKETGILLAAISIPYSGYYALTTVMATEVAKRYHLNETQSGLMYLPLAAGSVAGAFVTGYAMNWNFKRHCTRLGLPYDRSRQMDLTNFPIERVRLEIGAPMLGLGIGAQVAWGWTLYANAHIAALCVISVVLSMCTTACNNTIFALLVDLHPGKPGAATAANNLARGIVGAVATAVIQPMLDALGIGWAFTILGVPFLICAPVLWLLMVRGIEWRAKEKERKQKRREKKEKRLKLKEERGKGESSC